MKLSKKIFFFVIILLFFFISVSFSKTITINDDRQFALAKKYMIDGDFDLSVSEFKKFIVFFPNDSRIEEAHYNISLAYFKGKAFLRSIKESEKLLDKFPFGAFSSKAYILIAENHKFLGNFKNLKGVMYNFIASAKNNNEKDEAYYQYAWFLFEIGEYQEGKKYLLKISKTNQEKYNLKTLNKKLLLLNRLSKKDPKIAGTLALIPGLGFAYCNRYKDALVAFLFNAGLIFGASKAFENNNTALGAIVGVVELGFYTGNVYGSISSAHKYNKKQKNLFFKILKNYKLNFNPHPQTLELSLSIPF